MYNHTERLGQDKANLINVQQGKALPGWVSCWEETLTSRRRRMFGKVRISDNSRSIWTCVLLLESRTSGLKIRDRPARKLKSLFSASPQSPRRLHQGEPGNQINQKAIRKAKRNTPPALRAVIFQSGVAGQRGYTLHKQFLIWRLAWIDVQVSEGSPTGSEEVWLIMGGSVGMVLPRQIKEVGAADGDDLHPSIRPGGATSAPLCCGSAGLTDDSAGDMKTSEGPDITSGTHHHHRFHPNTFPRA